MSNPAVYDGRQRDGVSSIQKLARQLCMIVGWAAPIIELKYRNNAAMLALLAAVKEVCNLLPAADAALIPSGDNSDPIEDPTTIPGVDVSAPAPPDPPEEV